MSNVNTEGVKQDSVISLFDELRILRKKDIPEVMMYENIDLVVLPLLVDIIDNKCSGGEAGSITQ
ncbi:hypothetical protein C1645_820049 [Glomus cerebriforme]|uniref:Uncharacterized protein n=1 Tax=Glomus cerebriforme TaxID=658196 RepID=A0A397T3G8_9GLOM|nr:hypothetical protein C1645_820049 [Glomus cerebriforme]